MDTHRLFTVLAAALGLVSAPAATTLPAYYAHPAVEDAQGVIAPWYRGLNGPWDLRVRIAAETLKRYPWTTTNDAVAAYPHYVFSGVWQIASNGVITPKNPGDWMNGDLGQRATSLLNGWVDYYRYTGDPAAIAHLTYMAEFLIAHAVTPPDHPWPGCFISVPVKGKAYGTSDPRGMIQLDLVASTGQGLLRASQLADNARWREAAEHWGDLLAEHCNLDPAHDPWPRYANPESAPWKDNKQTGGVTMILSFLDDLIRLGHTGKDQSLLAAREAGQRYLREKLLPAWAVNDTWGRYFWDWANPVQNCLTTPDAARYLMDHPALFPNWRTDARNILSLFLNHSSVAPDSGGDVFSGAWAYPEASQCCGRSLWYAPICVAPAFAQYAAQADSAWFRALAVRQLTLATYDTHENGVTEDNIDGGIIVNGEWFNIAQCLPLRWVLAAMAWLPEELAPSRENHILRSSAVVQSVVYDPGWIAYTTYDAPPETTELLRLSFVPKRITAGGKSRGLVPKLNTGGEKRLKQRTDLRANGYTVKLLANGDAIVGVRHDGAHHVTITGHDPQQVIKARDMTFEGQWGWGRLPTLRKPPGAPGEYAVASRAGAAVSARFRGNQVRLIGHVCPFGGLADVYLDGQKQWAPVDCWYPGQRFEQVLFYRNGLSNDWHTLKLVVRGATNLYDARTDYRTISVRTADGFQNGNHSVSDDASDWPPVVSVGSVQYSAEDQSLLIPTSAGPAETQRMIFGYTGREDYRDGQGHLWRPGTELVTRIGAGKDAVAECWWTNACAEPITGTEDPECYRYGVHGRDFWANLTVGPGKYYVRLKFAATRNLAAGGHCFDVRINGQRVAERLDVAATAGGPNRAVDLVFNDVRPSHGVIEVRLTAATTELDGRLVRGDAFIQALEVGPGSGGKGVKPISAPAPKVSGNLLLNPGFEETTGGLVGTAGLRAALAEWSCEFDGPSQSYVWQERDYAQHPDWGLPEFHTGPGALRTHTDGQGRTRIVQEVPARPDTRYEAGVWVRAADLRGKGFGHHTNDCARLRVAELDANGRVLRESAKAEVRTAGPYTRLAQTFTTGPQTATLRFILEATLNCRYEEGHVTFDDCWLWQKRSSGLGE